MATPQNTLHVRLVQLKDLKGGHGRGESAEAVLYKIALAIIFILVRSGCADNGFCPVGCAQCMDVGIGGQNIFVTDAVSFIDQPGASFHLKGQIFIIPAPF